MQNKKKVAIYLSGVNDIKGGGGVERFFADFFDIYSEFEQAKFELFFFTDQITLNALKEVNKLQKRNQNIVLLKNVSNRFKEKIENIDLYLKIRKYKIDVFHCANYGRHDFKRLRFLSKLKNRPYLIQNIVDCQIPYVLENSEDKRLAVYKERYVHQPNIIQFDGVFSWYALFEEYMMSKGCLTWNPIIQNINSRFADISNYKPASKKEKIIVFASRMHFQKRPDWFLKAILDLKQNTPNLLKDWKFLLLGHGDMAEKMELFIQDNQLDELVERKLSGDLSKIYPTTMVYVSTQDYENFPSLSMMEAMACGNLVVARNVGQTELMVENNVNGFLLEEDSPLGLSKILKKVISLSDIELKAMGKASLLRIRDVHNPQNFINQIESFWQKVLDANT